MSHIQITDVLSGKTQFLQCTACDAALKKGVVLSHDNMVYGVDCAAREMGVPISRARKSANTILSKKKREYGQTVVKKWRADGEPEDFDWGKYGFDDYFHAYHGASIAVREKAYRRRR